jgi:hypothetical protein
LENHPEIDMSEVGEDSDDLVFIAEGGDQGNDFVRSSMPLASIYNRGTLSDVGVPARSKYGQGCS